MDNKPINQLTVGIKGAGEMATGIARGLYRANIRKLFMMEIERPLAVRRKVSFCEAICTDHQTVENVEAVRTAEMEEIALAWRNRQIPVLVDPQWHSIRELKPDVVLDATIAKRNLGTTREEARLVIGLGPGFTAGKDVDIVIETNRGHNLGRIINSGCAEPNTGVPGSIGGHSAKRVLRAGATGTFDSDRCIGELVKQGDCVGTVDGTAVTAQIDGVLRGLIRPGIAVSEGLKIGDIDPRGRVDYCVTISDKSRAIGGAVLTAILSEFNTCPD